MPETIDKEVNELHLDLKNFRTTPQPNEIAAVKAMISIKPDRFYAVLESILENGYLRTENIIVIIINDELIVREGNRRIAVMKLIHGLLNIEDFILPQHIKSKISQIDPEWKSENRKVPCSIYKITEAEKVEKIVSLTHAKGEKASRDPWSSVARARYDRDTKGLPVPSLDILEKYLEVGQNINGQQKQRWSGDYPITVLDEAIRKIYLRLGVKSAVDLAKAYPKIQHISEFEEILLHIGLEVLGFEGVRSTQQDFAETYSIFPIAEDPPVKQDNPDEPVHPIDDKNVGSATISRQSPPSDNKPNDETNAPAGMHKSSSTDAPIPPLPTVKKTPTPAPPKAIATNDPKHVTLLLKRFSPRGNNRHKVVLLRDELRKLKIVDNPIAFCLLVRSIFEISAKIYCDENGIATTKVQGTNTVDRTLSDLLNDATAKITSNNSNKAMVKVLHGAKTEITQPGRILSVTSMNQLVHNSSFSVVAPDICTSFSNIYPLLEALNS